MIHARADYNRIQDPAVDKPSLAPGSTPIAEDEPVFLLRARDQCAPAALLAWAYELETVAAKYLVGADYDDAIKTATHVRNWSERMRQWGRKNGVKIPDTPEGQYRREEINMAVNIPIRSQEIWDARIEQAAHTIISMWDETVSETVDGDYHETMQAMLDPILRGMVFDDVASPEELNPSASEFHPWERPEDELDREPKELRCEERCDRCGGLLYLDGFQMGDCNCPPPPEDGDADLFIRRPGH